MILAGDIGGTKTNIAFFEAQRRMRSWSTRRSPATSTLGLDEIVRSSSANTGCASSRLRLRRRTCPHGQSQTTNLPWVVDAAISPASSASQGLGDQRPRSHGLWRHRPGAADFVTLNAGAADATGNAAIIAAGTGSAKPVSTGMANPPPFATEGGHANFGATDALERVSCAVLSSQYDHVSWERCVRYGLCQLYHFLRDTGRAGRAPPGSRSR